VALLDVGPGAMVRRAAVALFGVATTPIRLSDGEALLVGTRLDAQVIRAAAETTQAVEALSDIHAGADYRRHLGAVMTRRALTDAAQRAGVEL
jgi:CO/xanthine dehydrogenase FAD-binding subunit